MSLADGVIQVVEFANATSGKHIETLVRKHLTFDDAARSKIPGASMERSDFEKMSLFQKVDNDGNTSISRDEWMEAFVATTDAAYLRWQSNILAQLRDLESGNRPTMR